MRRLLSTAILGAILSLQAAPSSAGPNVNAKIVPHVLSVTTKDQCSRPEAIPSCSGVVSQGSLYPALYYTYILVMDGLGAAGIRGLQCGIDYDGAPGSGIDVYGWTLCATLQFASSGWPAANTGNLITWAGCQNFEPGGAGTGVTAVAGYLYMASYSPDVLKIRTRPVDGLAKVADCAAIEDVLLAGTPPNSALGQAAFSAGAVTPGYSPCGLDLGVYCLISGPGSIVSGSTGNVFSVSSPLPGAIFDWSITGDGSIASSPTGSAVSVTAGATGSLTLRVDVTSEGVTRFCTRNVTVTAPPSVLTCSIFGPNTIVTGSTGNVFSVSSSSAGSTFSWSITGNGSIVGSTAGSSISVTAGAEGPLALRVDVTNGEQTSFCTKNVTVSAPSPPPLPTCSITGPDPVVTGSAGHVYTVSGLVNDTFVWSISGDGAIAGPTTGTAVTVDAGSVGSFLLDVAITRADRTGHCSKLVNVDPLSCGISGPDPVYNLATLTYASTAPAGSFHLWSVTGNATISGPADKSYVLVNTGGPGTFTLHLVVSSTTGSQNCEKTVTVNAGSGSGGNANAKIALHTMGVTTKNACGARGLVSCNSVVTNASLYPSLCYVYTLVLEGNASAGVSGVQFGITYDNTPGVGIDVYAWNLCATTEQGSSGWPASGGGNLLTWTTCQRTEPGGVGTGVTAVGGYFYMAAYTPDTMRITTRPSDNQALILDCNGLSSAIGSHVPSPFGAVGFGGFWGYNPCGYVLPVHPTTWSAIKSMYPK